jgi:hypothetical protein
VLMRNMIGVISSSKLPKDTMYFHDIVDLCE